MIGGRRKRGFLAAAALALGATAAPERVRAEPGDELGVTLLTFGPGDHPFFKFGHNALWIRRPGDPGLVFNFGTFQFDSPALIAKFLRGRFKYWLSVTPAASTLAAYEADNRSIEAQDLALASAQKLALYAALRENARPENREYLYDYFWDNCSTRVRDALDRVTGGALKAGASGAAPLTMREEALRMTADLLWEYLGLDFGLGSLTDREITFWEAAFLPERLRDLVRKVRIAGPDGASRPLLLAERTLYEARRPQKPVRAPSRTSLFAAVGLLAGGGLVLLGRLARSKPAARVALGATTSLLGAVFGLLGLVLVLLWVATNHRAAHANANILPCAPWLLWLVPLGVGVARRRTVAVRRAAQVALATALILLVGFGAKLLPGTSQDNLAFILLFLPLWLGLGEGLRS